MKTANRIGALVLLATGMTFAPAAAQDELFHYDGQTVADRFGAAVSRAGDRDGDGVSDLLVGAPRDIVNGNTAGTAQLLSGADGSLLDTFAGQSAGDGFGTSVACAGDVTGDGTEDLIVGAPGGNYAQVFDGATGTLLRTFSGAGVNDGFGASVSTAGDLDGDGLAEVIVGASQLYLPSESGYVQVLRVADGSLALPTLTGQDPGDHFGTSVSGGHDADGDTVPDFAVGAPQMFGNYGGYVRVFSGADGSELWSEVANMTGDHFGFSVCLQGNVDGAGGVDCIVGAFLEDTAALNAGHVYVYEGSTGQLLDDKAGEAAGDFFGYSVGTADVDDDGYHEYLVGAPEAALAYVYSGETNNLLFTLTGDGTTDRFGVAVAGAGLITNPTKTGNDGYEEVLVGAIGAAETFTPGYAKLFSGAGLFVAINPELARQGDQVTITTWEGGKGDITMLVVIAVNGTKLWYPLLGIGSFAKGKRTLSGKVPAGLAGNQITLQAYALLSKQLVSSPAETLTIQ